jgi:hypothetical protein
MIDSITTTQPPHIYNQKGSIKKMSDTRCETKSSPARRTVSFAQTDSDMGAETVRFIPALSEFSKEEIRKTWYSECEFRIMKLAIVQVLRKMIAGTYQLDIDGLENESRGLESKTPKGSDARKKKQIRCFICSSRRTI